MTAQIVVVGSCMVDMVCVCTLSERYCLKCIFPKMARNTTEIENALYEIVMSDNNLQNCYSSRLPKCGETIFGTSFQKNYGGKGANQCIAASRLGAQTALIARLGDDSLGKEYLEYFQKQNINTDFVSLTPDFSSGVAQISVADSGDNTIIIVPGANNRLSPDDIKTAEKKILEADVVLFQFETPIPTTIEALKIRQKCGKGYTIVNGAPAVQKPDPEVYELATIFCVNETEAEIMTGLSTIDSIAQAENALKVLLEMGCNTVILTTGENGALIGSKNSPKITHVPTPRVKAVDTTGAGDAFLGALAYFLALRPDLSLEEQTKRACQYATLTVQKPGTQISYPDKNCVPKCLLE